MTALDVLPAGPMQGSILVTVFVGVLVMTWFSESYGSVYSGLVIPGYLAPLLIVAPLSALMILLEGLTVYVLVRLL